MFRKALVLIAAISLVQSPYAKALTITPSFDSTITTASNSADIQNAINYSATTIGNLFSNPGNVNILFKYAPGSFLGSTNASFYSASYSQFKSDLLAEQSAHPENTILATTAAHLANGNDADGSKPIVATSALIRSAFGVSQATGCFNAGGSFVAGCSQVYDAVITISNSLPMTFVRPVATYNGTNTSYDAIRVIEHEIDEALGGGGGGSVLGSSQSGASYGILDLYRYSANGVPSFTTSGSATSYFSVDGGATVIMNFNQDSTGDYGDWARGICSAGHVQDAFACNNIQADVTVGSPEYQMLLALGYNPMVGLANIAWDCSASPDATNHAGAISAVKTGSCTQVVTGFNTYTNGTSIIAGRLQIGDGGTNGSITGDVANNGVLAFAHADSIFFSGVISGTGALQKTGSGNLFLTGTNTYTGGTTVNSGGLFLGNGTPNGSIVGDVVNYGTFGVVRPDAFVFSGNISGPGIFDKDGSGSAGAGNLFLTGTNTYTGGTVIYDGGLFLGNGGTTGSIVGDVVNNSVFGVVRSNAYEFAGNISGPGLFDKDGSGSAGAGNLFLTGTNTYTGGTVIYDGALFLGNGGISGSIVGNVVNNSIFGVSRSDAYVFSGAISGTGAFQKLAGGNLFLTNTNTYTGGTAVNGGGLFLGNGGTTGSIVGNVVNNSVFGVVRSNAYEFSGNISGPGWFDKDGSGSAGAGNLFLTGTNTYSGGTVIYDGGLFLGNGGTSGSIVGNVVNNSVFGVVRSNAYEFAGDISGPGLFDKDGSGSAGAGNLFLTGTNTYTGGTVIYDGGLFLGNGGTTGSIVGNVTVYSVFGVVRSNDTVFSGNISGPGVFDKDGSGSAGAGTVKLTGNNSYSGGTLIYDGGVEAAASNTLGTGNISLRATGVKLILDDRVNLQNNINVNQSAFIDVIGTDTATLSGALIGSAPFEKDGTGTLILNHDNQATYSGNISYHGALVAGVTGAFGTGTVTNLGSILQLLDGVTFTNPVHLVDDLTLTQNGGLATLAGNVSGSGGPWSVIKDGAGTLVVTGNNSYTGTTTVAGGTLIVNGTIASNGVVSGGLMEVGDATHPGARLAGSVMVGPGGTLSGHGTVGGSVTIGSGGALKPGGSVGTLTVASASFSAGSTYAVETTASGQADLLTASGTVGIGKGATLLVTPDAAVTDYTRVTSYTILHAAGGITGTFSTATSTSAALLPSMTYTGNSVSLTLIRSDLLMASAATANQRSVSAAIAAGGLSPILTQLAPESDATVAASLNQLSGDIHASLRSGAIEDSRVIRDIVLDHLNCPGKSITVWGAGFGGYGSIGGNGNAAGLHHGSVGFIAGVETNLESDFRLGLAGALTGNNASSVGQSARANGDSGHLVIYGGWTDSEWDLKAGGDFGWGRINLSRTVAAFSQSNRDHEDQQTDQVFAEVGYRLAVATWASIEPYIDLASISARTGPFTEEDGLTTVNGITTLSGGGTTQTETYSMLGLRLLTSGLDSLWGVVPHVDLGWQHGLGVLRPHQDLTFQSLGQTFTVWGAPLASDAATARLGFDITLSPNAVLSIDYDGSFAGSVQNNAFRGVLGWML